MGWCSGGELAGEVWEIVAPFVKGDDAQQVAEAICDAFSERDCDTLYEQEDLYNTAYPWAVVNDSDAIHDQFATEEEARAVLADYAVPVRVALVSRLGVKPTVG